MPQCPSSQQSEGGVLVRLMWRSNCLRNRCSVHPCLCKTLRPGCLLLLGLLMRPRWGLVEKGEVPAGKLRRECLPSPAASRAALRAGTNGVPCRAKLAVRPHALHKVAILVGLNLTPPATTCAAGSARLLQCAERPLALSAVPLRLGHLAALCAGVAAVQHQALRGWQASFRARFYGCRWQSMLTSAGIGSTDTRRRNPICTMTASTAKKFKQFTGAQHTARYVSAMEPGHPGSARGAQCRSHSQERQVGAGAAPFARKRRQL